MRHKTNKCTQHHNLGRAAVACTQSAVPNRHLQTPKHMPFSKERAQSLQCQQAACL
jgi:hypothetical protein